MREGAADVYTREKISVRVRMMPDTNHSNLNAVNYDLTQRHPVTIPLVSSQTKDQNNKTKNSPPPKKKKKTGGGRRFVLSLVVVVVCVCVCVCVCVLYNYIIITFQL